MAVEITENAGARRFELRVDGELAALVTYARNRTQIALTHTETEPGFEGQGYAKQLVEQLLANIRDEGLDLLPFCPFVSGYLRKHPEWLELVPANARAKFDLPPREA